MNTLPGSRVSNGTTERFIESWILMVIDPLY
jgi:hypothetical protein